MKIASNYSNVGGIINFPDYLPKILDLAAERLYIAIQDILGVAFRPSGFVILSPVKSRSPLSPLIVSGKVISYLDVDLIQFSAYENRSEDDIREIFSEMKRIFTEELERLLCVGESIDFYPKIVFDRPLDWLDGSNILDEDSFLIDGKRP